MQIIEVSAGGVRSAVITLRREATPMRLVLFPMAHLGTPDFYQGVAARAGACDLVVAEGAGKSLVTRALTLAYRLPGRSRRLDLVVQRIDFDRLAVPVIRADITVEQFRRRWRAIPVLQRLAVWCAVPLFAVGLWLFGTRRLIGSYMSRDDKPRRRDPADGRFGQLHELLVHHRDELLLDALASIHEAHRAEPVEVAVVYGAGHMPAVTHGMRDRYGYRAQTAEWLTIFDF
jgi:hypothetical protein